MSPSSRTPLALLLLLTMGAMCYSPTAPTGTLQVQVDCVGCVIQGPPVQTRPVPLPAVVAAGSAMTYQVRQYGLTSLTGVPVGTYTLRGNTVAANGITCTPTDSATIAVPAGASASATVTYNCP